MIDLILSTVEETWRKITTFIFSLKPKQPSPKIKEECEIWIQNKINKISMTDDYDQWHE